MPISVKIGKIIKDALYGDLRILGAIALPFLKAHAMIQAFNVPPLMAEGQV